MNVHASALIRAPYPVSTPKNAIIARARLHVTRRPWRTSSGLGDLLGLGTGTVHVHM